MIEETSKRQTHRLTSLLLLRFAGNRRISVPAPTKCRNKMLQDSSASSRTKPFNYHVLRPRTRQEYVALKPKKVKYLQNDFRKVVPRPRCAFVTMVMCGEEYAQGAATLAWSLRQQKTAHELVVMVTPDVRVQVQKLLRKLYDRVIKVDYIETKVRSALRGKKYRNEDKWVKFSLTKACLLKFTEYDKIVWIDADTLVLKNIDCLFELSTPAGICSSIRDHDYWHGLKVPELEIENSVENNYGVLGCIMVLSPNLEHYLLASSLSEIERKSTFLGPDEYFFTELYKAEWNHIHVKFCCTRWHAERLDVESHVIHFMGAKPWEEHETQGWEGVLKWRASVAALLQVCPLLSELFYSRTQQESDPKRHSTIQKNFKFSKLAKPKHV